MLFNSFHFIFFVILTFLIYYLPHFKRFQTFILIFASFIYYASDQPKLLVLLVTSILLNSIIIHFIVHGKSTLKQIYAGIGVATNIGLLAFFKYGPLFGKTFFNGIGSAGHFLVTIPLPLGISFITFQAITLLVDTCRDESDNNISLLKEKSGFENVLFIAHYISFFPRLIAGPIVKSVDFIPQIEEKFFKNIDWDYCFRSITTGYFLKLVIADNLKDQTFWIQYPYFIMKATPVLLSMLFSYSVQIFADFAGYSLIAIGVAGLFGYKLPQNFNFPYISKSFAEFWTRWHMTLSLFLKEYLYIPLGGNRKGVIRTYANIMLVMLLGGFWHGAAWSYMAWGGVHGGALVVERLLSRRISFPDTYLSRLIQTIGVFTFVSFAWLFFKLPDFSHVLAYIKALFDNTNMPIKPSEYYHILAMLFYCLPVLGYHLHYLWHQHKRPERKFYYLTPLAYGLMLFFIITNSGTPGDFVYFQF